MDAERCACSCQPREPELEIPQQICRNLVVENIENKDDHCFYWTLRWSSICENGERLSKACPYRKKDCIFATMRGIGLKTTTARTTFLADNGGVGRIEVPPPPKRKQRKVLDIPDGIYLCDAFAVEKTEMQQTGATNLLPERGTVRIWEWHTSRCLGNRRYGVATIHGNWIRGPTRRHRRGQREAHIQKSEKPAR